jgi:putative endonuclease
LRHCKNLETRLKFHNAGKYAVQRGKRPFSTHYAELFQTKFEACKREFYFKTLNGRNWLIILKLFNEVYTM